MSADQSQASPPMALICRHEVRDKLDNLPEMRKLLADPTACDPSTYPKHPGLNDSFHLRRPEDISKLPEQQISEQISEQSDGDKPPGAATGSSSHGSDPHSFRSQHDSHGRAPGSGLHGPGTGEEAPAPEQSRGMGSEIGRAHV